MRKWQRDIEVENYRNAQKPCTCGNNEDLCVSCQAKEERGIVARDVRLEKRQEREEYGQS